MEELEKAIQKIKQSVQEYQKTAWGKKYKPWFLACVLLAGPCRDLRSLGKGSWM